VKPKIHVSFLATIKERSVRLVRWRVKKKKKPNGMSEQHYKNMKRGEEKKVRRNQKGHRTGGTANKLPTNIHETRNATTAERMTISQCARTITGLRIRVSGTANAGTALTILKPLRAFSSVSSVSSDFEFKIDSLEGPFVVVGEAGPVPDQ